MLKRVLVLLIIICISLPLCISCSGDFFENELNLRSSSGGGKHGDSTVIRVTADAVGKLYDIDNPLPDPPLTYTFSPDPLPHGVSMTGKLVRDSGEYIGTYVIRQGTLRLTGINAGKYTLKFFTNKFSIYKE